VSYVRARCVCMCSVVLIETHAIVVPPMTASTSSASPSCRQTRQRKYPTAQARSSTMAHSTSRRLQKTSNTQSLPSALRLWWGGKHGAAVRSSVVGARASECEGETQRGACVYSSRELVYTLRQTGHVEAWHELEKADCSSICRWHATCMYRWRHAQTPCTSDAIGASCAQMKHSSHAASLSSPVTSIVVAGMTSLKDGEPQEWQPAPRSIGGYDARYGHGASSLSFLG
jgi:hypothetical protein